MEQYDEKGRVICILCGKPYHQITPQHLKKEHNMTIDEFKDKYPDASLTSLQFRSRQKYKYSTVLEQEEIKNVTPEIKIEECSEFDLDKVPEIPKNLKDSVSNFVEDVKNFSANNPIIRQFPNPNNIIHREKLKILNYLYAIFDDLRNSYFIEKSASGSLEYRLVTDICVPNKMLILEFPNTFWHNFDIPENSKYPKLRRDGWTIIEIPGPMPSIKQINEILKKFDLI